MASTVSNVASSRPEKDRGPHPTIISSVVFGLYRRSREELPPSTALQLSEVSYTELLEWFRSERMAFLPGQASTQDNILKWAYVFVERLHAYNETIEHISRDSYLAADLAYGYCGLILELGRESESAQSIALNFFYSQSTQLETLGRAANLYGNAEINEGLVLVMADLVTLVAAVSTHFYQAILGMSSERISLNIQDTFSGQIRSFRNRCEGVKMAMSKHQLLEANGGIKGVESIVEIPYWLAPDDEVVATLNESGSCIPGERGEWTCRWIYSPLTRWRKGEGRLLHITGRSGSGKSVLSSAVLDKFKDARRVTFTTLFVPISTKISAQTTISSIARSILSQLYTKYPGNIQILRTLIESLDRSRRVIDGTEYDDLLWDTVTKAIASIESNSNPLVIVVDGTEEASCDEATLLGRLVSIIPSSPSNVKLVTTSIQKPPVADDQEIIEMSIDETFDDIERVVRSRLQIAKPFHQLSETEQDSIATRIAEASNGSFLWAIMASEHTRVQGNPDQLRQAIDALISDKPSIIDLVFFAVQMPFVTIDAKWILLWIAISQRPLHMKELISLVSVDLEKQTIRDEKVDVSNTLTTVNSLVYLKDDLVILRHSMIRDAVMHLFSQGHLVPTKDPHGDLVARLLVYLKAFIGEPGEPDLEPLKRDTALWVQKSPVLDYALRYWPFHLRNMSSYQGNDITGVLKDIVDVLPISTTSIKLQDAIWARLPAPESLCYRETMTKLYRNAFGVNHLATVQCLIVLATQYRDVGHFDKAIPLFNEALDSCTGVLTAGHPLTSQLSLLVSDLTKGQDLS
ncbi:tetratricopeptide repeat protein [Aspergillus affinis]|uniref:tetratricopeptide repeat protein n=1 Tax=Aspergillus affinis TaxID=1070780 RepID=UPI0022FE365A|nr:uncharacterized protein KD926_011666 [Aspergillus affinis]KAI9044696.1 hypothetical protein KD926_011666 [Aspergillus affinis]